MEKEWGNPEESKQVYEYIMSYSPYENIKPQRYPAMYITASTNDFRAPFWQTSKYVSRLRKNKRDDNLLVFQVSNETGHFGSGGRYGQYEDFSKEYAFLFRALGLKMK